MLRSSAGQQIVRVDRKLANLCSMAAHTVFSSRTLGREIADMALTFAKYGSVAYVCRTYVGGFTAVSVYLSTAVAG